MSLAQITLHGNVGSIDKEVTVNNRQLRSFSVAKTEAETVNGETKYSTTWFKVVTSDQFVLEKLDKLKKGDEVMVIGSLKVRPYQTRDGRDQIELRVSVANSGSFVICKGQNAKADEQTADNEPEYEGNE